MNPYRAYKRRILGAAPEVELFKLFLWKRSYCLSNEEGVSASSRDKREGRVWSMVIGFSPVGDVFFPKQNVEQDFFNKVVQHKRGMYKDEVFKLYYNN